MAEWPRVVAVAVGMLSRGPVIITATFVGFLVAGFWGSLVSDNRDFLAFVYSDPGRAPILLRHRANPNVQGVVKGAYTAAIIGAILRVLLGKIAIAHWLTALIAAGSPAVLFR
jgi:chromate transporter